MKSMDFISRMVLFVVCILKGVIQLSSLDEELCEKLLYLLHDLPLAGHFGMFWMVTALSSRCLWSGM